MLATVVLGTTRLTKLGGKVGWQLDFRYILRYYSCEWRSPLAFALIYKHIEGTARKHDSLSL
jgi:hypothetical protein